MLTIKYTYKTGDQDKYRLPHLVFWDTRENQKNNENPAKTRENRAKTHETTEKDAPKRNIRDK
jgi:hypothetical protein